MDRAIDTPDSVRNADNANDRIPPREPRGRIFRKYLLLFAAVISTAVVVSGGLTVWFTYQEQLDSLAVTQEIQAEAAADKIDQFATEIERQLRWVTNLPWSDPSVAEQRRFDALRLLSQVEAATELSLVDPNGREQLRVSRLAMDVANSELDLSADARFTVAVEAGVYFGPVYYRRESEPYMSVAVSGARSDNGVAIAEVNLLFLWDLVTEIAVGATGNAYVVDANGRLIAHPDNSLVLRNTDLAQMPQVAAALAGERDWNGTARALGGDRVVAASASIPRLGWVVFTELPVAEAMAPIYQSVFRTAGLLGLGIALAVLLAVLFTRRMVGPVRALEAGAAAIGAGDLSQRIDVRTGDELEALAGQFNIMAARLTEARAGLERRVAERTAELAEKSKQLEAASSHKSQFLANMSHELRTPLNAILGFAELLLDGIYGPLDGKTRQVVERVQANGDHLLGLINDVLDLSKIEAGELSLSIAQYDLGEIVRAVARTAEPLAKSKSLELRTDIAADLPHGWGDERRLHQVLLNLVGNAVKFTDVGSVQINASLSGEEFVVAVTDTGRGIAADDLDRVFGEFQQADPAAGRGGTGLGLSISRHIIELHGGRIDVDSKQGVGSTFRSVFPIIAKDEELELA